MFPIPSPGQAGSTTVGMTGTQLMSLAVLHQMQRFPPAHGQTSPGQCSSYFTHFQTLTNTTRSPLSLVGEGRGKSSHLLTILLSLLACGIVESSPFTLILVGDCTLRCSGSMDCWQVDMGM